MDTWGNRSGGGGAESEGRDTVADAISGDGIGLAAGFERGGGGDLCGMAVIECGEAEGFQEFRELDHGIQVISEGHGGEGSKAERSFDGRHSLFNNEWDRPGEGESGAFTAGAGVELRDATTSVDGIKGKEKRR